MGHKPSSLRHFVLGRLKRSARLTQPGKCAKNRAIQALRSKQPPPDSTAHLIQKFSADGRLLTSYFPVSIPSSMEKLQRLAALGLDRLVVLPNGETYFLRRSGGPELDRLGSLTEDLYHIDATGGIRRLELIAPSEGAIILGIHKYGSDLVIEWRHPGPPRSIELMHVRGESQESLGKTESGVLALGNDKFISYFYAADDPEPGTHLFVEQLTR